MPACTSCGPCSRWLSCAAGLGMAFVIHPGLSECSPFVPANSMFLSCSFQKSGLASGIPGKRGLHRTEVVLFGLAFSAAPCLCFGWNVGLKSQRHRCPAGETGAPGVYIILSCLCFSYESLWFASRLHSVVEWEPASLPTDLFAERSSCRVGLTLW